MMHKLVLKSDLYFDLLQKKNDLVILKPSYNRSELTIGCPFKPDIKLFIITEGHEHLTYAFMIRDKIKEAICKANSKRLCD